MTTRRRGRVLAVCGAGALALAAGLLAVPSSGQIPQKALECNSSIEIQFSNETAVSGGSQCDVRLRVANRLSRDIANMAVAQNFPRVRHFVSCSSLPCVANPALPVTFVAGSQGGNCGAGVPAPTVNPAAGEEILFDFGSPGFNLGPADPVSGVCNNFSGGGACGCEITYRVFVPNSAGLGPFPTEARTMGDCVMPGGFTSAAIASTNLTKTPTVGAVALAALGLALLLGAVRILRRAPLEGGMA